MAAEIPFPIPVPTVAELVLGGLEAFGIIPDPTQWLFSLFDGRPTLQATADEASVFLRRRSPVLQMLGLGAATALHYGIPLSSPTVSGLFGPYFQAAVLLENAIRFGNQLAGNQGLTDQTLTAAMHEAGNPGSGTATMDAIDAAWAQITPVNAQGVALAQLAALDGSGIEYQALAGGVAARWVQNNPSPTPPPPAPPPPTPQPPKPPPPPTTHIVHWNVAAWQTISGEAVLGVTVQGGPNPNGHIGWQLDGVHIAGPTPVSTQDATTPVNVFQDWDSTTASNGTHTLNANWWTELGLLIANSSIPVIIQNAAAPPPTPAPPPPTPPPPPPPAAPFVDFNVKYGTVVKGLVTITMVVGGAAFTSSKLVFHPFGGALQTLTVGPSFLDVSTPVKAQFDSTALPDGLTTLQASWYQPSGTLEASKTTQIVIQNSTTTPPPPPNVPPTVTTIPQPLQPLCGDPSLMANADTDPTHFGQYNAPGGQGLIGGPLLDNVSAAARVVTTAKSDIENGTNGPANTVANNYFVSYAAQNPTYYASQIADMLASGGSSFWGGAYKRVDGACPLKDPTTAEIIQWACHKWGINPILGYGEAQAESHWDQTGIGDFGTSVGLFQVANSNNAQKPNHAYPFLLNSAQLLPQESTAFNADFWAAHIWTAFNGLEPNTPAHDISIAVQSWFQYQPSAPGSYAATVLGYAKNNGWMVHFPNGMQLGGPATIIPGLKLCTPTTQPPPPPGPPPPPPTPTPQPVPPPTSLIPGQPPPLIPGTCAPPEVCLPVSDPSGEGTSNDVRVLAVQLQSIAQQLQWFALQYTPADATAEAACCQNIVAALGNVANAISVAAGAAPPVLPPATVNVDLASVATALNNLTAALTPGVSTSAQIPGALHDIVNAINTAAANQKPPPPVDFSALIAAIKEVYSNTPANQQAINWMASLGLISAEVAQATTGSATISIDPTGTHPIIAKWLSEGGSLATLASTELADAFIRLIKSAFEWFMQQGSAVMGNIAGGMGKLATDITNSFGTVFAGASALETDLPKVIFEAVLNNALPPGGVTADNVEDKAFQLLGSAFLVGQGVHLLAELAGYLKYPASSVWAHNAEMMIELLGYKEILRSFHGAFYPVAVRERARQKYNKQYTPHVPQTNEAFEAFARSKIDQPTRDAWLALNGRDPSYVNQEQQVRYKPISPRMLVQGFRNHLPPADLLDRVIRDQGITPEFHDLVQQIIDDACYQKLEESLANKMLAAVGEGVITLDAAKQQMTAFGWDTKAQGLAAQSALIDQQAFIVKEIRREVIDGIKSGQMDPLRGTELLQSAGAAPWLVDHTVSLAKAEQEMRLAERLESEEIRLARQTLRETQAALEQQYLAGNLDLPGLSLALEVALEAYSRAYAAIGATPEEVAAVLSAGHLEITAITLRMQARSQGREVHLYGLTMDSVKAELLKQNVDTAKEEFLRDDLTYQAAQQRLLNLGIPQTWVTLLVNRWNSQLQSKGTLTFS